MNSNINTNTFDYYGFIPEMKRQGKNFKGISAYLRLKNFDLYRLYTTTYDDLRLHVRGIGPKLARTIIQDRQDYIDAHPKQFHSCGMPITDFRWTYCPFCGKKYWWVEGADNEEDD